MILRLKTSLKYFKKINTIKKNQFLKPNKDRFSFQFRNYCKMELTEEEWKARLTPEQYKILRLKGTEKPGSGMILLTYSIVRSLVNIILSYKGEYNKFFEEGVYLCAGCENPLYESETKFDSGCGWPAFYKGIDGSLNYIFYKYYININSIKGSIDYKPDYSLGMSRTEILCSKCGGHLGHVFKGEGFNTPTDERHCVNSLSLKFKKK